MGCGATSISMLSAKVREGVPSACEATGCEPPCGATRQLRTFQRCCRDSLIPWYRAAPARDAGRASHKPREHRASPLSSLGNDGGPRHPWHPRGCPLYLDTPGPAPRRADQHQRGGSGSAIHAAGAAGHDHTGHRRRGDVLSRAGGGGGRRGRGATHGARPRTLHQPGATATAPMANIDAFAVNHCQPWLAVPCPSATAAHPPARHWPGR